MLTTQPQTSRFNQFNQKFAAYFPATFFFGGFLWDALTIGRSVTVQDLMIFAAYLLGAAIILYMIGRPRYILADDTKLPLWLNWRLKARLPYFMLQFLFGNLLSALFILYFKSSNHWLAWLVSLLLATMLVANEFLENEYRRFTLSWALFGLCAMLLLNFALPFAIGSILSVWFYLSTLLGAVAAHWLYTKTPNHLGSIYPVWLVAATLMLAYAADMVPPVPLVKRDIAMAYALKKVNGDYQLSQQKSPWWVFWRKTSNNLQITPGQRVYCFSSVFAPAGLKTRLYHRWQIHSNKQGWVTTSHIGFSVSGGRYDGFRGYTYKQNITAGEWRVSVETESEKTIAVHNFTIKAAISPSVKVIQWY